MKMRIIGGIAVAIVVSAILPPLLIAAPQVSIYTDKGSYQAGEAIEVSLAGGNYGEGTSVDVYIGLLTPDGALYTLGELVWWQGIGPWIRDIYLPSQFSMERSPFFWFPLPCEMPPIHQPGEFAFMAGLTHPATFDFASAISAAPFEVVQVPRDYYVDAELGDDASDGSENAPWRTITHALDSVDGFNLAPVTVHVAAGTYSASANGESFPLNVKSFLSLVGEGANTTVLDAESASSSVIYCSKADHVSIEGFTITGGSAKAWPEDSGGGIYCDGGSPTIRHNTITGNSADRGGGIYCTGGSWATMGSQTISDNIISDNSAHGYYGGGIHCDGSYPTIQNNTIEGNSGPMWGGGISCDHGYPVISGNTIRSNSAGSGGGVYCYSMVSILGNSITDNSASSGGGISCDTSTVEISDNTISDNWVYCSGGGIYSLRTDLVLTNNQILGNSSGEHGGGISCEGGTISNNTIAENTAEADGGGVWCEYVISFNNNTIVGNVAWGLGGGIYSFEFPGSRIRDCIVWNNGDDLYDCTATFCCVQDPDEGQGNIHDDPMFVSGPFGEYYLHPDSPCIDAGSRSAEDAGLSRMTTQTDGTPDTGTVDMGVHYPVPSDSSMRTSLQFHE